MSDVESDEDVLANLLANIDSDDSNHIGTESSEQIKPAILKELDYNFIDSDSTNCTDKIVETKSPKLPSESVSYVDDNVNSSDDEDKKYFEKQRYSEYGREIKCLLKNKEPEDINFNSSLKKGNNFNSSNNINYKNNSNCFNSETDSSVSNDSNSLVQKSDQSSLKCQGDFNNSIKKNVDKDPIFGFKIIKPLISSSELIEKMQGRKAVSVSSVKLHLTNQSMGNSNEDWVIGGIILNKSLTKTSQKGNQYCIWKITDLGMDMKTVSIFLFSSAYKNFWKVSNGTVISILNPSVLESRDDKDLATLSVNNSQKVLILGFSRDLGKCKSVKKNGEPCTSPVNLSNCEYCVYHIKQEYGKYSRRSELQTTSMNRTFGISKNTNSKQAGVLQRRHPDALPFIAIPAKRNEALFKKDCERLALLRGDKPVVEKTKTIYEITPESKVKKTTVEFSSSQSKKDIERLNKLRGCNGNENLRSPPRNEEKKVDAKFKLPTPKLGSGMKGGMIDFSESIPKNLINRAKLNAIEWVKRNGSIKKLNPNNVRPDKELLKDKGRKRKREDKNDEKDQDVKNCKQLNSKFQKMMEMKSVHSDLIQNREDEEMELYFKKGESKERLEIKMLETFKINCKAVYCSVCKYVAFSGSDLCKTLQHPVKVIDAVKRFFKCANCENRTVSLDRIPANPCKKCSSIKWVKTSMMDEKKSKVTGPKLCIRGGEEKFIGSTIADASLNLLIPESN
ncbi:PREDICTED: protein MCM10 homolog [Ceratosolen solmsi marchali]|uniref:Protein MCM10 homolog n=1 Tax=Ceratosolen solmsi marchali TaxID=326594 RepID=A0AAJ6YLY1_9HYME|nr:PREDICTED: protein MCM10 homolog [Ceratosolen solmsi marchali]